MILRQRQPREHDEPHLAFIRELPCIICHNDIETEAAHVRYSEYRLYKDMPGRGAKPDDCWVVPLCGRHHREQSAMNERAFWEKYVIDPLYVALALWRVSGDHMAGCHIARAWR